MIGQERLQNRTSGGITPSASADNLRNQRKCSLIAAKIAGKQCLVKRKHAHQRDIWKIQSLSNHLRTNHNFVFLVAECCKLFLIGISRASCVRIHAEHPCFREQQLQLFFHLLCPKAHSSELFPTAMRTSFRHRLHVSAVVTHQLVADFVIRHRYTAIGTINRLITGATANHGMIAPPIQQQQYLFPLRKRFLHRIQQCIAKWCPIAQLTFSIHVYNCNFWKWHVAIPFLQFQQRINALFGIVVAFNGWCCRCQQQRTVMGLAAFPSDCNRMIARSVFGFIRPFALFIDNQNT